jgi:hypothetical protein
MPIAFGNCETHTRQPILVLQEARSRMVFANPARSDLRQVKVDGCLNIAGIKCDFLVISATDVEHFVELKGADVRHAAAQLEATIGVASTAAKHSPKHSFIISTRCPLLTPEIQNLKARFKKHFNSSLIIKNIVCEFLIV